MIKHKKIYITLIIVLIISSLLGNFSENMIKEEIVYITPRDHSIIQNLFHITDIEKIKTEYPWIWSSYQYETTTILKNENKSCTVKLIVTNEEYNRWNNLILTQGSFFLDLNYEKDQLAIDEEVAFKLLGTSSVIGDEVYLDSEEKSVRGISKPTKVKAWAYKKQGIIGEAYIIGASNEKYADLPLNGIIIGGLSGKSLEDQQVVNQIFMLLEKEKVAYQVISLTKYSHQVKQYTQILISSIILSIMIGIGKLLLKGAHNLIEHIKKELKFYYLIEYIAQKKWYLLGNICLVTIILVIVGLSGTYFIKAILNSIVESKVSIGNVERLPYAIKCLQIINQVGIILLAVGEILIIRTISIRLKE